MNEYEKPTVDPSDRLDRSIHADLGKLGWRTPQSDAEVRMAESELTLLPSELPGRLREVPDIEAPQGASRETGLLAKYLKDEGRFDSSSQSREPDRSERDLNR